MMDGNLASVSRDLFHNTARWIRMRRLVIGTGGALMKPALEYHQRTKQA